MFCSRVTVARTDPGAVHGRRGSVDNRGVQGSSPARVGPVVSKRSTAADPWRASLRVSNACLAQQPATLKVAALGSGNHAVTVLRCQVVKQGGDRHEPAVLAGQPLHELANRGSSLPSFQKPVAKCVYMMQAPPRSSRRSCFASAMHRLNASTLAPSDEANQAFT